MHKFIFMMCYNVFSITIIIYKSMSAIDILKRVCKLCSQINKRICALHSAQPLIKTHKHCMVCAAQVCCASISRRTFAGNAYYSDSVGFCSEGVLRIAQLCTERSCDSVTINWSSCKVPNTMQCAASHIVRS